MSYGASLKIAWDANTEEDLDGYKVYYGTSSGNYGSPIDVGNITEYRISGLNEGVTYYITVTAIDFSLNESDYSNEVFGLVEPPQPNQNIWLEAEDGEVNTPMEVAEDEMASSGQYVWVPNGEGTVVDPAQEAGYAEYDFNVHMSGDYVVWGRVISNSDGDDSFFVSMDNGEYVLWDTPMGGTETWVWDQVSDRGEADPLIFHLEAGVHTLVIKQREDGTKIDKILITNEMGYVPGGLSEEDIKIWLEAEDGEINTPMEVAVDEEASSGKYVWVPNGEGTIVDPAQEGGYAEYDFNVPVSGDYVVWGRVISNSDGDDSFFVSMDDGEYALWDTLMDGTETWIWDQVSDRGEDPVMFHLEVGVHTLVIKQREDGTKIDKILITNDIRYVPIVLRVDNTIISLLSLLDIIETGEMIPDHVLRNRWILIPALMFIEGKNTHFDQLNSLITFDPPTSVCALHSVVVSATKICSLLLVMPSWYAGAEDETVTVKVKTGTEVIFDTFEIEMLP